MKKNILKLILISGLFLFLIVTYTKVYSVCNPATNTECYPGEDGKKCMGMGGSGNCETKPVQL